MARIVKLSLLVVVICIVLALIGKVGHAIFSPPPPAPVPVQQQAIRLTDIKSSQPAPSPAAQTGQQKAAKVVPSGDESLKPLDITDSQVRKGATVSIWNVQQGSEDMIPSFPQVFSGPWKAGTEISRYSPATYTGKKIFGPYTLTSISFLIKAEQGDYAWIANGGPMTKVSVYVDDQSIISPTDATGSGYAKLQSGYHSVDIRVYYGNNTYYKGSFSVQMKRPTDPSAAVISRQDMYIQKAGNGQ
jgi:hypothetical protein